MAKPDSWARNTTSASKLSGSNGLKTRSVLSHGHSSESLLPALRPDVTVVARMQGCWASSRTISEPAYPVAPTIAARIRLLDIRRQRYLLVRRQHVERPAHDE